MRVVAQIRIKYLVNFLLFCMRRNDDFAIEKLVLCSQLILFTN